MPKLTKTPETASKPAAKPRKTAAKKTNVLQMEAPKLVSQSPQSLSHQQVAELAHRFWDERGRVHGHHEEDWFRAEELLRGRAEEKLLRGKAS